MISISAILASSDPLDCCSAQTTLAEDIPRSPFRRPQSPLEEFDSTKRNASYFPSEGSLCQSIKSRQRPGIPSRELNPSPLLLSPKPSTTFSKKPPNYTEAQLIVLRYRAGEPLGLTDMPTKKYSVSEGQSDSATLVSFSEPAESLISIGDEIHESIGKQSTSKLVFDEARIEGLRYAKSQATEIIELSGLADNDLTTCPQPDCGDEVRAQDLMYHLDIHNIEDSHIRCTRCQWSFETEALFTAHQKDCWKSFFIYPPPCMRSPAPSE